MLQTIANAWKIPDLKRKMLITLLILVLYRFGSFIPVPGIDPDALTRMFSQSSNNLFGFVDILTGGSFSKATIFAMGITPYINASIIMQLLTVAIPSLERMVRSDEDGRKKLAQYTRYLTVVLAFLQSVGYYLTLNTSGAITSNSAMTFVLAALSFTGGTALLMWLGENITEHGVGNGISLLIFAGIVSRGTSMIQSVAGNFVAWSQNGVVVAVLLTILFAVVALAMVTFVVVMYSAERRIPIQYAKRVVGRKTYGGQSSHLPIKVNVAGVIPIIFAISILTFPATIGQLFGRPSVTSGWGKFLEFIGPTGWFYAVALFLLIIFFTYFYTAIQFNPIEISNNLKKNGGFIPGIRPGKPTSDYVSRSLTKITIAGATFLGILAVSPIIMGKIVGVTNISIGGTSLLILVGVAIDTVKQLESQMLMRHYKGFLE